MSKINYVKKNVLIIFKIYWFYNGINVYLRNKFKVMIKIICCLKNCYFR